MLTGDEGELVQGYLYTPFGELWAKEDGAIIDTNNDGIDDRVDRLFTGQMYDKESGLYYMNARYYDPDIGTFMTADPAMSGLNHYAYTSANPIKYTDPTGMDWTYDDAGDATAVAEAEEASAAAISQQFGDWPAQYLAEQHSYFRSGWWNEWDWARAENTPGGRSFLAAEAAKAEREREEKEFDKHLEWQRQYLDKLDIPNYSYLSQKQIEKMKRDAEEKHANDKHDRWVEYVGWRTIPGDITNNKKLEFITGYPLSAGKIIECGVLRNDINILYDDLNSFMKAYNILDMVDYDPKDGFYDLITFNNFSFIQVEFYDPLNFTFTAYDSRIGQSINWNILEHLPFQPAQ